MKWLIVALVAVLFQPPTPTPERFMPPETWQPSTLTTTVTVNIRDYPNNDLNNGKRIGLIIGTLAKGVYPVEVSNDQPVIGWLKFRMAGLNNQTAWVNSTYVQVTILVTALPYPQVVETLLAETFVALPTHTPTASPTRPPTATLTATATTAFTPTPTATLTQFTKTPTIVMTPTRTADQLLDEARALLIQAADLIRQALELSEALHD